MCSILSDFAAARSNGSDQNSSVFGSGIGSCFDAFTRLSTLRTPNQMAISGNSRKPTTTSISRPAAMLAIKANQKVRMRTGC